MYDELHEVQGSIIPRCYGLYYCSVNEDGSTFDIYILLLESLGERHEMPGRTSTETA